jgi:hypothetical protein
MREFMVRAVYCEGREKANARAKTAGAEAQYGGCLIKSGGRLTEIGRSLNKYGECLKINPHINTDILRADIVELDFP